MAIVSCDWGGTSIKVAVIEHGEIQAQASFPTPATLDEFQSQLDTMIQTYQQTFTVSGIAISAPGAVESRTGMIGGASAIAYIHDYNWYHYFGSRYQLPVSMANDANCAALGEVHFGAAKGKQDVLFVVVGTGIGGAVVKDGELHFGANLHGGEFGYMLTEFGQPKIWSETASTQALVSQVQAVVNDESLTGEKVFELANTHPNVEKIITRWYRNLAIGIYNLQYSFDPECFVIGGAVSERDEFVDCLQQAMQDILRQVKIATIEPKLYAAKHGNNANLYGAYVFHQQLIK